MNANITREIVFTATNNIGDVTAPIVWDIDPISVNDITPDMVSDILDSLSAEYGDDVNYAPVYADTRELYVG